MADKATRPLPPKRMDFIKAYTDKDAPTYGNGRQSYMQAYGVGPESADASASNLLRDTRVQNEVQSLLESFDRGYNVRLKEIDDIASGYTIVSEVVAPDGTTTYHKKPVSPRERLEAHKYLNRLSGEEDRSRATGKIINDRLVALSKRMLDTQLGDNGDSGVNGGPMGEKAGVKCIIPSPSDSPDTKTQAVWDPWGDTWE